MKRSKVFVIPVVLLLFVVLPAMLHAAQEGVSQHTVADPTGNESYRSHMDPFRLMMEKGVGNPRQRPEAPHYPIRRRDQIMNMGIKDPAYHAFREKRPDRKSDAANTSANTWKIEAVDDQKYFTDFSSRAIAVDGSNHPHIAYGGDHLYHAYHDGSTWYYQIVDSSPAVGSSASIALDTSGKVHISYYDVTNGGLKYATNASGPWVTTTVDSNLGYNFYYWGEYTSIAVDTSGKVHISYYDVTNGDLKYATNGSGSWVTTTVDSSGDVGLSTSLAVDTLGNVHISYFDYDNYGLKYATNGSGSWVTTTVDSRVYVSEYTSIAVDTSDKVHISYYDGDLKYATNGSGTWVTTTVDSGDVGWYTSIAVDTLDNVHISYYDNDNYDLKYATNGSGSWVTTTVDSSGNVGEDTSIAVDTAGNVHISYYDGSNGDLKYATNGSGSWVTTTVDSSGDVGRDTSIAVDTSGKVHISYFDSYPNADLKYATNGSGSWVTTTVDSGDVSGFTSIALDTSDKVHISYFDWSNYDLKYATNASGSWVKTTVDSNGDVGLYTSIAINKLGKVHISYFDETNHDLKYATNAINKPTVKTRAATHITDYYATLNGIVNAHGLTTRVWFQYGTTSGSYSANTLKKTVKGSLNKKVHIVISGLSSQMTYYYRIAARNKDGTSYGKEKSFTTQ